MKNLLVISLLLLSLVASAQQPWEPYLNTYQQATSPQEKLTALDSVLALSFRNDMDLFIDKSFEYLKLAKELNNYKEMAKKAMNLSYPLNSANRPDECISVITDVLQYKEKIQDSFLVGGLYLKRGGGHFRTDQQKAVDDYTAAIANFGRGDSVYVGDAYLFRGQANTDLGNFVEAAADYNQASLIFESLKDYRYMLFAKQGSIMMFSMNGFYDKALEERSKLIEQVKSLGMYGYLTNEYYNQAVDDRKVGAKDKALAALLEAEKYLDSTDNRNNMAVAVNGLLSTHYAESGNMKQAEHYLGKLEDAQAKVGDKDLITRSHYNASKSTYLKRIGEFEEALKYAELRLKDAEMLGNQEQIMHAYEDLYQIYVHMNKPEVSLEYYRKFHAKKDSLFSSQKTNLLVYYQTLYETEKQEREIQAQTANIALLEKDNEGFKRWLWSLGFASVLAIGFVYLIFQQKGLKSKQLLQEQFSQELLVSHEKERRRISKELHDGLGQNLLLIKNSLIKSGDDKNKEMVGDAIEEVRAISRALHPFQLQKLGLTKAIENMVVQIDQNSSLFISSEIENIDDLFSKDDALNVYRIIQEGFNNVIKHSGAEATKLEIKKKPKHLNITIQDNGKGFNVAEKYRDLKSMGLKTLQERTRFLKEALKINSTGQGTQLQFKIPI